MARQTHGSNPGWTKQPDRELAEKNDGTIEGTVVWTGDRSNLSSAPGIKSAHPDDSRCECYARTIKYRTNGLCDVTCSYFGLVSSKTEAVISYNPSTDREPIAAHPRFKDEIGGTPSSPQNGAKFADDTNEFLGFLEDDAPDELLGVQYYLSASTQVSVTYWQNSVPSLRKRMEIVSSIPGFRKPSDVKEFLRLDFPYRQIGSFYQVTELYLGSGPNGFSQIIYGK